MYVYGYLPYELTIYPVEKAGHVVATIQVMKDQNGDYCATYSMEFVDQLNCLLKNTDSESRAMAITDGESIEFIKVDESKLPDSLKERDTENRSIYDLSFNVGDVVKGTNDVIYICNWITHDIYSNQYTRCVPYSMHNILYNKGLTSKAKASSNALHSDMMSVTGNITGYYSHPNIVSYCSTRSIYYDSSSTSGKLAWGYVYQSINDGNYIMAICSQVGVYSNPIYGNLTGQHAIAVIGVSVSSTAASIIVYDPHGSGNGKYTVTYGSGAVVYSMTVTTNYGTQTRTNTWDAGYYRNLH